MLPNVIALLCGRKIIPPLIVFFLFKLSSVQAQCNLLCNTDFENLQNSPTVIIVDTSQVPCWGTTASDNKIEVWHTGYNGVPSYSGNQFIELNAFFVSTLFQNFVSSPGTALTVSFAHRGRAGVDVMSVEVGPVGGPYTPLGTFSDGTSAWGYYTVNYTIPSGVGNNFSLRFNSVSAAGGNPAIGNFLDAISVNLPSSATLSFASLATTCAGVNNGGAFVTVYNGSAPYSYTWTPTGVHSNSISSVAAGIYTVNVSESNGCTTSGTVQISSGPVLSTSITSQNESCQGAHNGSAQILVFGNGSPVSYTWSPGAIHTATASGLSPGVYSVQVSSGGCTASNTVLINPGATLSTSVTSQNVSCVGLNDGSAQVNASGSGPTTYTWLPGGASTSAINGLSAGVYTVQTSSGGCVASNTVLINQGIALTFSFTTQNTSCFGLSDGNAQATVSGGSAPYSYTWSPVGGNLANATGLAAGNYTLVSKSANGCMGVATVSINNGSSLNMTVLSQSTSCFGASDGGAQAFVSAGSGPYSYTWTPGALNTQSISGLASGNYTVYASGPNGCAGTETVSVLPGPVLQVALTSTNQSCFATPDGSVEAFVSGGTAPYTYTWTPLGLNTASVTGLASAIYTVQITSSEGCTGSAIVSINKPQVLSSSAITQSVSCVGGATGKAEVLASGGTAPYSYTWVPSGINSSSLSITLAGTYTCMVTDNNQCSTTVTVAVVTAPSPTLSVNSATICPGKQAGLTVHGANSYTWLPGNSHAQEMNVSPSTSLTYSVIGENSYGCTDTATASIFVSYYPLAFAGKDTTVNMDEPITLVGQGSDFYGWIPMNGGAALSCNLCHTITENPQQNTCYVLEAYNAFNCRNSDTVCVTVTEDWNIYIPNAFTPNNNDINDVFIPVGYGIDEIELMIFDRWGALIFKSDDKTKGWNGTYKNVLCKADVYVYKVNFTTMNHHEENRTGHVTLLK